MKQILAGAAVLAFSASAALACPMHTVAQSQAPDIIVAQNDVPMSLAPADIDTDMLTGSTEADQLIKLPAEAPEVAE